MYKLFILLFLVACSSQTPHLVVKESPAEVSQVTPSWKILPFAPQLNESIPPPSDLIHTKYSFINVATGESLISKESASLVIPASTQKVITSAYVLDQLGAEYRPITTLFYSGKIQDGILIGDLILKGGGDPILTMNDLMEILHHLKQSGIKTVQGKFYLDLSLFASRAVITDTQKAQYDYNPGVAPLALNYNQFKLLFTQKKKDFFYYTIPSQPDFKLMMGSHPILADDEIIYQDDGWKISNSFYPPTIQVLPVRDPPMLVGETFRELAKENNILLPSPIITVKKITPTKILFKHKGQKVRDIVQNLLEFSNNQIAETLLLLAASSKNSKVKTVEDATHALKKWIDKRKFSQNLEGITFKNGSGLETGTRVAPQFMTNFLLQEFKKHDLSFLSLFPINGISGTIEKRVISSPLTVHRIWAKSGTMHFAVSLTGFCYTQKGQLLTFFINSTDFNRRAKYDEALLKSLPIERSLYLEAKQYDRSERQIQDRLLKYVIENY